MKELRVGLTDTDIQRLFSLFDLDHDGKISYAEFVRIVSGEMNEARKQIVDAAFKKLDTNGDGVITIDDIKDLYKANRHPDVVAKRKTEGEVLSEFLDTFEQHYALLHPEGKDGTVTLDEFREYYNNLSGTIEDDKFFELIITNAWGLSHVEPYQKAWTSDY